MINICEYSYYLYLCKRDMFLYQTKLRKAMKTLKKRILKPFAFVCLGLTIATITFASVERLLDVPSPPGRPSPFDITAGQCQLKFQKPMSDGGIPIHLYIIEYRSLESGRWRLQGATEPISLYNTIQCTIDNKVGMASVDFRVSAENKVGRSLPSKPCDPITFRNPF